MRDIKEIIVHCTATPQSKAFHTSDVDRWHKERGFLCVWHGKTYHIGYHYLVTLDGTIEEGRPVAVAGAHCRGHNAFSIGVCYVGGLATDGKTPMDTRTPKQRQALSTLIHRLKAAYPGATVHGHRDYAPKACPSFDATTEYRNV